MAGMLTLGALGLGLSVDAFAASVGKGAAMGTPRWRDAIRIGAVFGVFEALMPCLGWLIGKAVATWFSEYGGWIAFILLVGVGGHMMWEAWHGDLAEEHDADDKKPAMGILSVALTAVATSIDALAVGVSLAVMGVPLLAACIVIGGVTTIIASSGVMIGKHAGLWLGRYAEIMGGGVLILIGAAIPVQQWLMGG
ncbi:manganese efflux pump MntP [Sphingomonas oryzagri]|uniref:Putative manganese efflux pump MntP n=1 Tax=Sphingomonas oryzagri TaxID=3042314 RepID=A0ABT6N460_9SPHN|nr:manganese efflux pump MntP family protein [Sphingomonas oryzagri]MDH7640081.1 manganese efflux pump MntP family protein [Sphingomonas oryzagri]